MKHSAFITTNTAGDLVVVSGSKRFFLPQVHTRDLLCPECTFLLLQPEARVDAGSTLTFLGRENLVLFTLKSRMYSLRYAEFLEVLGGDVQWMLLQPVRGE